MQGQYHWDCSDWARRSQNPLPDITEVPGGEVPDSSSFHSNESNESHPRHMHLPPSKLSCLLCTCAFFFCIKQLVLGPNEPNRDIETLNEEVESDELDYDGNDKSRSMSFDPHSSIPILNPLDSGSEDYRFSTGIFYIHI